MKVSALITCHNKAHIIRDVIEACVACDAIDEIVVYDDMSTDGSQELLKSMEEVGAIVYISGKTNLGVSGARNHLFSKVSSDLFVLLDGDDIILPEAKADQIRSVLDAPEIMFSYSDYWRSRRGNKKLIKSGDFSYKKLQIVNFIPFSSAIVRFPLRFRDVHHEDYLCWLQELRDLSDERILYYSKATYIYDDEFGGVSSNLLMGFVSTARVKYKSGVPMMKILSGTGRYVWTALSRRFP